MTDDALPVVAAFDFDGTLARGDSFMRFLALVAGRPAVARELLRRLPRLVAALGHDTERRTRAKEELVEGLLAHRPCADVSDAGEAFASGLVRERLHEPVVARLRRHLDQGHEVVIVSASPDVYLDHVGALLGVHVLATRLECKEGILTGRLLGANCRGPEKVARLDTWIGDRVVELYAYGDSRGDEELLARADRSFRIRRGKVSPPGEDGRPGPTT